MPKDILGSVRSSVEETSLHYRARCWQITPVRVNRAALRFTDHQYPLTIYDGRTFEAMGGMDSSAQDRKSKLEQVQSNARGLISDDALTDEDLERGVYLDAIVDEFIVDWRVPYMGPIDYSRFIIRGVSWDGALWNAELESTAAKLDEPVGDIFGPLCRVELFSSGLGKCNLAAAPFLFTTTINNTDGDTQFETDTVAGIWNADAYGQDGRAVFFGGQNDGFETRIKTYTLTGTPTGIVVLHERTPFTMLNGETAVLYPGCNKRLQGDCKNKFNNVLNFQGEPFIPGSDLARRGVSLK
jgi:uncharacterized phage protein (TIGR02218 family)